MRICLLTTICLIFAISVANGRKSPATSSGVNATVADIGPIIYMLQTVVDDDAVSHAAKIRTVATHEWLAFYSDHFDRLHLLYTSLLKQSKALSDGEGIFFCYESLADLYLSSWDKDKSLIYLDSAAMYIERTKRFEHQASYYRMRGQYIQRYIPYRAPEAVKYYHRVLSIYEKIGSEGHEDALVITLRNLTFEAFQRQDSSFIFMYYKRMEEISMEYNSPIVKYSMMNVKIGLYDLHHQYSKREAHLDSMVYYAKACLDINTEKLLPGYLNPYAIDLYIVAADALRKKEKPDMQLVDSLLSVAEANYGWDSLGIARVYQVRASILFEANKTDAAELLALQAENFFKSGYRNSYYSFYIENINLLRNICIRKKDYKKAFAYDTRWMEIYEDMKLNNIKELELQYEFDRKEREYKRLQIERQSNQYFLNVFLLVLLLLTVLIIIGWLYVMTKRRRSMHEISISEVKKAAAKLQLQLREDQTVSIQMEKYALLSDFYLKEQELIGKTAELAQLSNEKKYLDAQVEMYRHKIESIDILTGNAPHQKDYDEYDSIVNDLKMRIQNLPNSEYYLANLKKLHRQYIEKLYQRNNRLSLSYVKYCVCFAIGMSNNDVMSAFVMEPYSMHMIRYRLKKKFGLAPEEELILFLQKLVNTTVETEE